MAKIRFPSKIIPPIFPSVFIRQRLLDLLTENQHLPLVWVHGSAGAGKTTLISSWLNQQQSRFLWYRMDKGINECADLFYFLTLSAQRNYPRKRFKLPVFTAEYADDIKAFAVVFFRQLFALLDKEIAIVLDNCQEIENDPNFLQILQIALNDIPEGLQLICISRTRPANLFSRLSLANDLLDISPVLIRFTEAESRAFIGWLNPEIDTNASVNLQVKANGWAAALVLLAQTNSNIRQEINPTEHKKQAVFSFLMTEILTQIDETCSQFLANTAVFKQFTVSMAIALTSYSDAQNFLDGLVNNNFLIDRTSETPPVYCYHPLLRDLLNEQNKKNLTNEQLNELNRSAINILIKQKKIEEALPFYLQLKDWSALKPLLLKHAESLIDNGRHHALIIWMQQLPDQMVEKDPWLQYWYAVAIRPLDPIQTAQLLDQCYQLFLTNADALGLYSTWQIAVEAILVSLDDFSTLKTWFQRFDELREHYPHCPCFELKIKFSVTALNALAFYNPEHPWFNKLLKTSEYGFRMVPVKLVQQLICSQLGNCYSMTFEMAKLQALQPYLLVTVDDESQPALSRILNVQLIATFETFQGNADKGLNYVEKGLQIAEYSAISLFNPIFITSKVCGHICHGDLTKAQICLDNSLSEFSSKHRLVNALIHFYSGWLHALKDQLTLALEQNEQSLRLCQHLENKYAIVCCLGLKIRLLAEKEQWEMANQTLLLLENINKRSPNKFYQLQFHLSDAWCGFLLNDQNRVLLAVQQFLSLVRHEQVKFFMGWQPHVISSLCFLAIEYEIEAEYAISMLQINDLCATPPPHLEQWPWPVRIYCFNHLKIELDGQQLEFKGKSQKKVNELLVTIIALGSQDVHSSQVCEWLWPDSEGDLAQQSLESAIYRLRKLIGKSTILVKDSRISLNLDCCWIDVLAFESTLKDLSDVLPYTTDEALLSKLSNRLLHFYQGDFLKQIDSGVVKVKKQQLQNKFTRLIHCLVTHYDRQQNHNQICHLLERSLERVPRLEPDYQALINDHQKHQENLNRLLLNPD